VIVGSVDIGGELLTIDVAFMINKLKIDTENQNPWTTF